MRPCLKNQGGGEEKGGEGRGGRGERENHQARIEEKWLSR